MWWDFLLLHVYIFFWQASHKTMFIKILLHIATNRIGTKNSVSEWDKATKKITVMAYWMSSVLCMTTCTHVPCMYFTLLYFTLLMLNRNSDIGIICTRDDSNKIINVDGGYFVPAIRWMNTKLHPTTAKEKKKIIINKFVGCNFLCSSIRIYRY